jgi:hypothetical protein
MTARLTGAFLMLGLLPVARAAEKPIEGFLVLRDAGAEVRLEGETGDEALKADAFRPAPGRILSARGASATAPLKGGYEALLDDGKGRAAKGWVSGAGAVFFELQSQAEEFLGRQRSESKTAPSAGAPAPQGAQAATGHAQGGTKVVATPPTAAEPQAVATSLARAGSLLEAQGLLGGIQSKLKKELGSSFLGRVKKDWKPSGEDRTRYVEAIEKALTPKERAFFALVSTAFSEDRQFARGNERPEDAEGRARMLFTMKIVESRANSGYARQFMNRDLVKKGELDRMWGAITQDRQFSSWNAGSSNFGNTINAMLGLSNEEKNARDRALAAYRDFSLAQVSFEGFDGQNEGATLMLNRREVGKIQRFMKRDLGFRRQYPRSIVPWTVESIMHNQRFKPGVHQVALRVSQFSIALPKGDGVTDYVRVRSTEIGHWPAYLHNVHSKRMEDARRSQGEWEP